jgi:hypothetical protein
VKKADALLYQPSSGKYAFYLKPFLRKEWVVIVREYNPGTAIYELVTAFKADCSPPYKIKNVEDDFPTYYKVMEYLRYEPAPF